MIAITDKNDVISIYRECQRSIYFLKKQDQDLCNNLSKNDS